MKCLTDTQTDTISMIRRYHKKHGFPPTYQELADMAKVTKGAIQQRIGHLVKKGFVGHKKHKCRTLVLVGPFDVTDKPEDYLGR